MPRKLISTKEFRETYKPGDELPRDLLVCRAEPFSLHKEGSDAGSLIKTFTISTSSIDREGDRLLANWELNNFNKGGSVLWAHDSRRTPEHVIAAPKATWQEGEALKSRAQFTPREINPVGFMVHQLIDFGALRSSSVGFNPLEWKIIDDNSRWGYDFEKIELLEWSVVPVPANPEALVDAKAHGIDIDPMTAWLEEVLDKHVGIVGVERDVLEASWKVVAPEAVAVYGAVPGSQNEKQRTETRRRMPGDDGPEAIDTEKVMAATAELTQLVIDATETLTGLVAELEAKVSDMTKRMDKLAETAATIPAPKAQPAIAPGDIEIDLSDPVYAKILAEEIGAATDTTIRKLQGKLPD